MLCFRGPVRHNQATRKPGLGRLFTRWRGMERRVFTGIACPPLLTARGGCTCHFRCRVGRIWRPFDG
jgi:hypothetical protein